MIKTLTFTPEQLYMLLDVMEGFDISYHSDGNETEIAAFDKLYKRILCAYRKTVTPN